jgi:L-2-hydroxycarboxylate dehydrogenase (NAD+)
MVRSSAFQQHSGEDQMSVDKVRLPVAEAREVAERTLQRAGFAADEARIVAEHMIDAALCGYEYSGLAKILNVIEAPRFKQPRRPISVLRETDISTLYDGGNNVGMLALYHATQGAIEKARARGIALVGITNSWMSGRSAHFVEMIAKADLVGIHTVSCSRLVAPLGGTKPILGTNPIAFGLPSAEGPIVFDMGTSAFMMTEVMLRERMGESLPEGVALDRDGQPTTDAKAARQGALLPFGGYKGFGLAFVMQALGLLAGSSLDLERDNGYLFIAFKPDLLVPLEQFRRELGELTARVKAVPRQQGVEEIRIPSERAFRSREKALREGIEVDRAVLEALRAV